MQGDPQILEALNRALTIELTAINQYFCQAKMCKNWGYLKLAKKHYEESMGEMKHAEKLIDRILFLEGTPDIARYDVIRVGTDVKRDVRERPATGDGRRQGVQCDDRFVHPRQGQRHA
jgi:bacterioferritin